MNWEAVGAVGEVAGAIAVVATLFYLANQIRTQNSEARAAAVHEISLAFRENVAAFGDPVAADLFTKFNAGKSDFSDSERVQLFALVQRNLRVWEEGYVQFHRGRLDDDVWQAMNRQYVNFHASPSSQWVWELRKEFYMDAFRRYVDSLDPDEYKIQ